LPRDNIVPKRLGKNDSGANSYSKDEEKE